MTTIVQKTKSTLRPAGGSSSLVWPAVLFVVLVYVVSLMSLVLRSMTDPELGLHNYIELLTDGSFYGVLWNTIFLALIAAVLAVLIGYPIAYMITQSSGWLKVFLIICVATPYLTSILIRTFSWQVILGQQGPINSLLAGIGFPAADLLYNRISVVIGLSHSQIPLVVLALVPIIRSVDANQMLAARSLGTGVAEAFVRIFLPATKPGIQVAFILAFIYSVGSFAVPALLGGNKGRMVGSFIHSSIEQRGNYTVAATSSVVLAVVVIIVLLLFVFLSKQKIQSVVSPGMGKAVGTTQPTLNKQTSKLRVSIVTDAVAFVAKGLDRAKISQLRWLMPIVSFVLALAVMLPQLFAIPVSFAEAKALVFPPNSYSLTWYENFFTPKWLDPTIISFRMSVIVAIIATLLGALAAIGVARGTRKWVAASVTPILLLPLVFPAVVAAGAFYIAFLQVDLNDTQTGIILAHVSITLPQAFALIFAGIQTISPDYERAAASLGAPRRKIMYRIFLPLLSGSLIAALGLTFITSFDESTIAVFLSGVNVKTLPRRIFESVALETDPTVGVVAVVFMAVTAIGGIVWVIFRSLRKRLNKK